MCFAAKRAKTPDRWTALKLVPLLTTAITVEALESRERVGMSEPGAATHMVPVFEYAANSPLWFEAATGTTPAQLPGKYAVASPALLPAAAMRTVPVLRAKSMEDCR
jgi:hypothetical protein